MTETPTKPRPYRAPDIAYTFRLPLRADWKRLSRLLRARADQSILRHLEYELLDRLALSGRLLDFGGGERANYRDRMDFWARHCIRESVNIDPAMGPTHLVKPGAPLPFADDAFDHVLALNTLEHVFAIEETLRDVHRVLKPGGGLVATVPFLFRIHGHPDDFLRATPSWWGRVLWSLGYRDIVATPLVWGPFSTGLSVSGAPGPFRGPRMRVALALDLAYLAWRRPGGDGPFLSGPVGEALRNSALGFLIEARKADPADRS